MKYSTTVVMAPPELPDDPGMTRRRGRRRPCGLQLQRDALADLRDFHPFFGRMPAHSAEVAEEIGARVTVLAIRTHTPMAGRPLPPVTLRMRHALRMLARSGGRLTVSGLAGAIGVGVPAASQLSGRMSRREVVSKERKRDGGGTRDGRECIVSVSPKGWRYVPRDEPPQRRDPWSGLPLEGAFWWERVVTRTWPNGVRRFRQPDSPIEEGLLCAGLQPPALLTGLRAVQATITGYRYEVWETEFQSALVARRRHRRDRPGERYGLASLGGPRYEARRPARAWLPRLLE